MTPDVPLDAADMQLVLSQFVPYQDVIGVRKFCQHLSHCNEPLINPLGFDGAISSILIFILVNVQLKLLYSQVPLNFLCCVCDNCVKP